MNKLNNALSSLGKQAKAATNTNNKGKWREIEQLKEKFQLERDLKAYEDSLEFMLDDF